MRAHTRCVGRDKSPHGTDISPPAAFALAFVTFFGLGRAELPTWGRPMIVWLTLMEARHVKPFGNKCWKGWCETADIPAVGADFLRFRLCSCAGARLGLHDNTVY